MTEIVNNTATTDVPNGRSICDRSGFKAKRNELVPTWDGLWVLPEYNETRSFQDFIRVKGEEQTGARRPEPIGNETYLFNGQVTTDDL